MSCPTGFLIHFIVFFTFPALYGLIIACLSLEPNTEPMQHYTLQTRFVTRESMGNRLLNILQQTYNIIAYAHGCHLYLINQDSEDSDYILVTELWDSQESHAISQSLDRCKELMSQASPLLAAEPETRVLRAVAGKGLI